MIGGDVYMGVGPEQNFTYIAAIRPKMAFIVDIRRQAIMQHLMFKAMFEMAKDRADFISILFGKPRPPGIDTSTSIQKIWEAYRTVASDSVLADAQLRARRRPADQDSRIHVHAGRVGQAQGGVRRVLLSTARTSRRAAACSGGRGGDFADLTGFSADRSGQPRSFLSSEENYQYIKSLHEKNLIVPVSGDFAGPKAIRAIGAYLKEHHGTVRAFYVSNVEQYLFRRQQGRVVLRQRRHAAGRLDERVHSAVLDAPRLGGGPTQSLCPIGTFLIAANGGRVGRYDQTLTCGQ